MAFESYVLVCGGTACVSGGGDSVVEEFKKELAAVGLSEKVQIVVTGCLGFCEQGPIVKILSLIPLMPSVSHTYTLRASKFLIV